MFARPLSPVIGVVIALGMSACAGTVPPVAEETDTPKPKVVATTAILCEMTEAIAQETIDLTCLMDSAQDPHTYEPTPSNRQAIEAAQLIFYGGYNLEPRVERLLAASSTPTVAVYEQAVPDPLMGHHHHDHDDHGHDHSHDHSHDHDTSSEEQEPDPHIWHSAENGGKIAQVIATELSTLVPEAATQYQEKGQAIQDQLNQLHTWIKDQIATIPPQQRKLVTTHDAFAYYSAAYNIPSMAVQGLSTESTPTPQRLKTIVETVQKAQVPALFVETTTNPGSIEIVAREANVTIPEQPIFTTGAVGVAGMGLVPLYTAMLIENTRNIVQGLGGEFREPKL
ncbi:zinc ABC transporter substrate-binding protein [Spirulina subsalsa FACHB-351]|uniref:Zinc ABC transporter substrate-binding protein n=1 Tax=Spirulina subsalsa FACHB-351 TaxID=234711 RepID=A0ABT3LCS8_9CYAN|nr:zinc ABC transporter substrate-binding protein [Spirulina subsalsa]MCW6038937.1 zinc ABC transporter substrate-binding protein [Spirulina subsalsa FACHB-351]